MEKQLKSKYKERRIYFGTCDGCHHRFSSFKRSRIKHELCRKCRKHGVSKDQIPMFEPTAVIAL